MKWKSEAVRALLGLPVKRRGRAFVEVEAMVRAVESCGRVQEVHEEDVEVWRRIRQDMKGVSR